MFSPNTNHLVFLAAVFAFFIEGALAADPTVSGKSAADKSPAPREAKVAPQQTAPNEQSGRDIGARINETLIFSAPPRGTLVEETAVYQPIVDYLAKVTGKKIVFKYSDNWLTYSSEMTKGVYDIVFDGPAFNGWRVERLNHTPLVKLPEAFIFVVITTSKNDRIKEIKHLAGQKVCAHAPPNLGTLIMLSQFDNPARQPTITEVQGWDNSFKGLMEGKCVATVLPVKNLEKNDKERKLTKVVYKSRTLPNQALSAGPRVSAEMQLKIKQALLSEEGRAATSKLRTVYASKDLASASRQEYVGLGAYLKEMLYYAY